MRTPAGSPAPKFRTVAPPDQQLDTKSDELQVVLQISADSSASQTASEDAGSDNVSLKSQEQRLREGVVSLCYMYMSLNVR